jgi:general L-amino acid transport system permease protein
MATETRAGLSRPPQPAFYNDPRVRSVVYQVVVVAVVVAAIAYLVHNTLTNLARLGVASGFGFLSRSAGFPIAQTAISYTEADTFARAFVVGFINTLIVAVIGIVLATVIGFLMGVARLSRNWLVSHLAEAYVEIVRNIPVLLQLLLVYAVLINLLPQARQSAALLNAFILNTGGLYLPKPVPLAGFGVVAVATLAVLIVLPILASAARRYRVRTGKGVPVTAIAVGLLLLVPIAYLLTGRPLAFDLPQMGKFRPSGGMVVQPEFVALTLGLSIYTGSYIAEIVRSGILAVSKGQWEAAGSLGLTRGQTLRLIVIPQALRVIIPPQTNQYLNLTKNSSLAVAIGYPDFFNVAGTINNQTGQAVEVVAITMGVYLLLSLVTSLFMNWYNARIALVER